jgi:type II secretory ATPase GspE/PulE/Tfp pilus assembly ATPase PilB-like protein
MRCKETGFVGRLGIFELLLINDEVKNMIVAKKSANEIKKAAISSGMRVLIDDGLEKVQKGITTIEEVLKVTEEA